MYIEDHDGTHLCQRFITVTQKSDRIFPTPSTFAVFSPAGASDKVTVTGSRGWQVVCRDEYSAIDNPDGWVTLERPAKTAPDNIGETVESELRFSIMANPTAQQRVAELVFFYDDVDPADGESVFTIELHQGASQHTFDIGPDRAHGYVLGKEGGTVTLNVISDGTWRLDSADAGSTGWISLPAGITGQPNMGGDSPVGSGEEISVLVHPNGDTYSRHALLVFSRTDSEGDRIPPVTVEITQEGSLRPAISTPWISGEYSQRSVSVEARYYWFGDLLGSGIGFREAGSGEFARVPNENGGTQSGDGGIRVVITKGVTYENGVEYTGGRDYEFAAYLTLPSGETVWSSPVRFRSPGVIPGNGDQQKPDVNSRPAGKRNN